MIILLSCLGSFVAGVAIGILVKSRFDVQTSKTHSEAVVKWSLMNSHHYIGNVRKTNEISINGVIA